MPVLARWPASTTIIVNTQPVTLTIKRKACRLTQELCAQLQLLHQPVMHEAEQSLLVWHCIHSAPIVKDTLRYDDRTAVYQAVSGKKMAASPGQNSRWFWLSSKKIQSQASLRRVHNAQHTVPTPRFHQSWQGKNMAIHFMHAHAHENIAAHEVWRCERHSTKQPECGMRFHQR